MIAGRPLRFLMLVLGGWTVTRVALLVPGAPASDAMLAADGTSTSAIVGARRPSPSAARFAVPQLASAFAAMRPADRPVALAGRAPPQPALLAMPDRAVSAGWSESVADGLLGAQLAFARKPRTGIALMQFAPGAGFTASERGVPDPAARIGGGNRWSGAAWVLWRGESDGAMPSAAILGGSQAGARVDYALLPGAALRPVAYGRVSAALRQPIGAEGAAGLAIHPPASLPLTLAVERRQALSTDGRNDFAIVAAGGIDRRAIGQGLRLDGYAQTGMVGLAARDGFVDGRLVLDRAVTPSGASDHELAIGGGLWGGAQPGATRLDIGPSATLRLRPGSAGLRLSAEWRARVAGDARPSSGLAFTIGADF